MAQVAAAPTPTAGGAVRRRPYVPVAVTLGVVTIIEVNLASLAPYVSLALADYTSPVYVTTLLFLATIKASLVVAYYMHLRYEPKWLLLLPFGALGLIMILVFALLGQHA